MERRRRLEIVTPLVLGSEASRPSLRRRRVSGAREGEGVEKKPWVRGSWKWWIWSSVIGGEGG